MSFPIEFEWEGSIFKDTLRTCAVFSLLCVDKKGNENTIEQYKGKSTRQHVFFPACLISIAALKLNNGRISNDALSIKSTFFYFHNQSINIEKAIISAWVVLLFFFFFCTKCT